MCELNGVHFTNEGFFCILGGILKVFSKILESLTPDYVHVLVNGKIVKTGDASLAKEIEEKGYAEFKK